MPAKAQSDKVGESGNKPAAGAKRFSSTTLMIAAAVLLVQVAAVGGYLWFSSGPSKVSADTPNQHDTQDGDSTHGAAAGGDVVEELIVEGKATNIKRGTTYVYKYRVHAVVAQADLAGVKATIERRKATVEDAVRQAVARLDPRELDEEPDLASLRRVLMRDFEQIFGEGRIKDLKLPEWTRLKLDY